MSTKWSSPSMPQDVAELFDFLCAFIFAIHDKWEDFCGLCVPRDYQDAGEVNRVKRNISLLNSFAPDFFASCQESIANDVILALCRLLDPPKTLGQENVSLRNLAQCVERGTPPQHFTAIQSAYNQLIAEGDAVRAYRNKRIGHNDLLLARGSMALPTVTINDITKVILGAERLMSEISSYYKGNEISFRPVAPGKIGSKELLERLWILLPAGQWQRPRME